nr:hypothetical protein CFP56_34157 [Quercus suber]
MVSEPESVTAQASMAAPSSTMASSSTSSSSSMNVMNQPLLLLSNMSNMMTVKLDNTNYIVWKHQITMVLETYSLFELLEDPQLVPDKYLKDLSGNYTTIMNPDFLIWKSKEKALLTFISSTLTPSILALTVGCTSAMEVWKVLENRFSSISSAEEESLNEGLDMKDSVFAMAATTSKSNNNGHNQNFYNNGHNQSFNRGRGRGSYNNRGGKGGRGSH